MSPAFKDHFSDRSAAYAAYRPRYPAELAFYLAQIAPGRALALDVGCGSGQLSTLLAEPFDQVVATDASVRQIASATPHPRVAYRTAPCEASGLPDHSADLVAVAQAAHWFDLDPFYAEVRRVLRPGGVLALITYGTVKMDGEPGAVLDRFYHETLAGYWPPERRHVETGYRDLPFPFPEIPSPAMAMTAEWDLAGLLGYVETWSAVRAAEAALGAAPYDELSAALAAAWGPASARRELRWPLTLRVGRA
jgi:SAM-dependent methyltransferase